MTHDRRFGRLDILVNNAARGMKYVSERFLTEPTRFWETDPAIWKMVIDTNVNAAITMWNTVYLEGVVTALMQHGQIGESLLPPVSPLGWNHIGLTGDYSWHANKRVARGGFRPLCGGQNL
jgi:hypothetical protein